MADKIPEELQGPFIGMVLTVVGIILATRGVNALEGLFWLGVFMIILGIVVLVASIVGAFRGSPRR